MKANIIKNNLIYKRVNELFSKIKIKRQDNNKLKLHITFYIFSIISLITNLHHELWRDEAQSYLLSRLNLVDLFHQLKIEGHPILWYLVLKIINLPYEYIWIIPWIITLVSAALIIYKMDKPLVNKIFILFSVPIVYISSSFARSYCLAILLIILISIIYQKRYNHPLIYGTLLALLINTHVIFAGFVCSLILIDFYELFKTKTNCKNKIKILLIFIIGLLLLFLTLFNSISARNDLFNSSLIFNKKYGSSFITLFINIVNSPWLMSIFIIFFIYLIIWLVKENKKSFVIVLILSTMYFIYIITIYEGNYYIHVMLLIVLLFIYWQLKNQKAFNTIIGILFLVTLYNSYGYITSEIKYYYSLAKPTAEYIKYNINPQEKLYCLDTSICLALVPYLPQYEFVDIDSNEKFTYVDWTKNINGQENTEDYVLSNEQKEYVRYFIIPPTTKNLHQDNYRIIYQSNPFSIDKYIILEKK